MCPALIMGIVCDLSLVALTSTGAVTINDPGALVFWSDHDGFFGSMTTAERSVFLGFGCAFNSGFLYDCSTDERHCIVGYFTHQME